MKHGTLLFLAGLAVAAIALSRELGSWWPAVAAGTIVMAAGLLLAEERL